MPAVLLATFTILCAILFLFSIFFWIEAQDSSGLRLFGGGLLVALVLWVEVYINYEEVFITTTKSQRIEGVDVVVYDDMPINLNRKLSRTLEPGTKVDHYLATSKLIYLGNMLRIHNQNGQATKLLLVD
jgi:hypothetical protein